MATFAKPSFLSHDRPAGDFPWPWVVGSVLLHGLLLAAVQIGGAGTQHEQAVPVLLRVELHAASVASPASSEADRAGGADGADERPPVGLGMRSPRPSARGRADAVSSAEASRGAGESGTSPAPGNSAPRFGAGLSEGARLEARRLGREGAVWAANPPAPRAAKPWLALPEQAPSSQVQYLDGRYRVTDEFGRTSCFREPSETQYPVGGIAQRMAIRVEC